MFIDNLLKVLLIHVLHTLLKVVTDALALSSLNPCTKRTDRYYWDDSVWWSFPHLVFLLITSWSSPSQDRCSARWPFVVRSWANNIDQLHVSLAVRIVRWSSYTSMEVASSSSSCGHRYRHCPTLSCLPASVLLLSFCLLSLCLYDVIDQKLSNSCMKSQVADIVWATQPSNARHMWKQISEKSRCNNSKRHLLACAEAVGIYARPLLYKE